MLCAVPLSPASRQKGQSYSATNLACGAIQVGVSRQRATVSPASAGSNVTIAFSSRGGSAAMT